MTLTAFPGGGYLPRPGGCPAQCAAELAQQAAAARPDSHQSQAELAWALMEAGQYAEAQIALMKALKLDPPGV